MTLYKSKYLLTFHTKTRKTRRDKFLSNPLVIVRIVLSLNKIKMKQMFFKMTYSFKLVYVQRNLKLSLKRYTST